MDSALWSLMVLAIVASIRYNNYRQVHHRYPCTEHTGLQSVLVSFVTFTFVSSASWTSNLNYLSPSANHPGFAVDTGQVSKRNIPDEWFSADELNFTHGIASGDPWSNSIILWTRIAPTYGGTSQDDSQNDDAVPLSADNAGAIPDDTVCVYYQISDSEDFQHNADSGRVYTGSDVDYTIKVEANGLEPFTKYYYQFTVCNSTYKSPLGWTKTTPLATDAVSGIDFAVFSCANYPWGYFNAFGNSARKMNVDYVLFLGDYIYEYAGNGDYGNGAPINRTPTPEKVVRTLSEYRARYACHHSDPAVQLSHSTYPWIAIWDDHEVADNTYKDGDAGVKTGGPNGVFENEHGEEFRKRKMGAVRAYFEWMPVRQVNMSDDLQIWRSFKVGSLFDLIMLDTRQYDRDLTDLYNNTEMAELNPHVNDTNRTMMGPAQEAWFYDKLPSSAERGATWRIVGSQTVFSEMNRAYLHGQSPTYSDDAWDGYLANRNRTLKHLTDNKIENNIFLAGDSHSNWVSDLVWLGEADYHPIQGTGALGVEFAGTAVTSPSFFPSENLTVANDKSRVLVDNNPELQWSEVFYRGYFELHISHEEVSAQYFGLPDISSPNPYEISLANFTVKRDANKLQRPVADGLIETGALKNKVALPLYSQLVNRTTDGVFSFWI